MQLSRKTFIFLLQFPLARYHNLLTPTWVYRRGLSWTLIFDAYIDNMDNDYQRSIISLSYEAGVLVLKKQKTQRLILGSKLYNEKQIHYSTIKHVLLSLNTILKLLFDDRLQSVPCFARLGPAFSKLLPVPCLFQNLASFKKNTSFVKKNILKENLSEIQWNLNP